LTTRARRRAASMREGDGEGEVVTDSIKAGRPGSLL
jgi:hypothetical protein